MQSPLLPDEKLSFIDVSVMAIQRWRLLLIGCFGIMLLAVLAWKNITRRESPQMVAPLAFATIIYPGASPEDIEAQVVKVVEPEILGLDGVSQVDSLAMPNVAQFTVKFEDDVNMDIIVEKLRGKIQGRKKELPAEARDAEVAVLSTNLWAQMLVAVVGNRSDEALTAAAKQLKDQLGAIPGVATIDLRGEQQRAIRVRLDPVRLQQHGLSPESVVAQLQLANVRIPAGELKVGPVLAMLQVNQEFRDASSVMKVAVGASSDAKGTTQVVTLGDVAEVADAALTPTERYMFNGQPAVGLELRFRSAVDAVAVGKRVLSHVKELESTLPEATTLHVVHDQSQTVEKSISSFVESLVEGILLVLLVITVGMGWRAAVVASVALPLAAGGALLGLFACGFSLDSVSIAGLIVALGLLVDDAVVVTESVQLMRDRGLSPIRAAVFGTSRVFWANNGTTAVACASFVPFFFMGGTMGDFMRGLPTAVILSLATSLVVAQLVTPLVSLFLLKSPAGTPEIPDSQPFNRHQDTGGEHEEQNPAIRHLKRLYARQIGWVLKHPFKVLGLATGMLVGALVLLPKIGYEFLPKDDKDAMFVTVQLPRGSREDLTSQKVAEVVEIIQKHPDIESTSAMVGVGYPHIYGAQATFGPSKAFGEILIRTKEGASTATIAQDLRGQLTAVPGASIAVLELYNGLATAHPIMLRLSGRDYGKLRAYAQEVKVKLRELKGTVDVNDTLADSIPLARVNIDADKAKRLGITPGQVGGTLRWLYGEDKVTEFRVGEERIQVVMEPRASLDAPLSLVEETLVPNARGGAVPLRQVGEATVDRGLAELARHNGQRTVTVTADLESGVLSSSILAQLEPWLRAKSWEPGYTYSFAGQAEDSSKAMANLGIAAIGVMLLVFLLLVLMFNSFSLSLVVMAAVPFAMIGAVAGLGLMRIPFGFMSFLGLIALIGVHVNHKIYFVERMQELMRRGHSLPDAVAQAGQDRMRPVVLTAMTAVLGLLPLTLAGGPQWKGFGWVNIFGLLSSIPLSLVLLPAIISIASRYRDLSATRMSPLRSRAVAPAVAPAFVFSQSPSPSHIVPH